MGLKAFSVLPGNIGTKYDAHQGVVILFETKNGQPLAIMDASEITAIRTAAASGVATRLLANEDACELAIIGSGVQAHQHLAAMKLSRNITSVKVWSRTFENAKKFAERQGELHNIKIEPVATVQEAVKEADIICTTTWAAEPVLMGDWVKTGAHINAAGASVPFMRELDTKAVLNSRMFVDRRESTLNEAGDFLIPKKEGVIGDDHIQGEIGEVLTEQIKGRASKKEITLFKSLGIALEDVAAAYRIYTKMVDNGEGTWIEFGEHKEID
jgi:ornithine cyclodeaminase